MSSRTRLVAHWLTQRAWPWLKQRLVFLLTPFVILIMLITSLVRESAQEYVLLAASVILVLLIARAGLPGGAAEEYKRLSNALVSHRGRTALVVLLVVVVVLLAFHQDVQTRFPGDSWAGLGVQWGLLLWPFSLLLYVARHYVSRRSPSLILAIVSAAMAFAPPFVLFQQLGDPLPLWQAGACLVGLPLLLVVTNALVRWWTEEAEEKTPSASPFDRARSRLVLASASFGILSAVLLLASAIRVPVERGLLESSVVSARGLALPPFDFESKGRLTKQDRTNLFKRYAPVLRLHPQEEWSAYDASVVLISRSRAVPSTRCEEPATEPCSEIGIDDDALPGLRGRYLHPPRDQRVFSGGAVYPRLVPVRAEIAELGADIPDIATATRWLIQYWLFYPNNKWSPKTAIGKFAQVHGGDWEWVGVGIDEKARPLFVAYSAHCAGSVRPWTAAPTVALTAAGVLIADSRRFPASHPLATVALGSHANYATPGTREPNWSSCVPGWVPKTLRWLTFAAAAREQTPELGIFQIPKVLTEGETARDARRPVYWGSEGETRLGKILLSTEEHGPASPYYQASWKEPMREIFASDWDCELCVRD